MVPEEFSPFPGAYVRYRVTNLAWSPNYVMFGANASFLATLEGKNVTFDPQSENQARIPFGHWNMTSLDDKQSHLLQGVRLSTQFINRQHECLKFPTRFSLSHCTVVRLLRERVTKLFQQLEMIETLVFSCTY